MNFLRTQTLTRIADSLKLFLNGSLWKTQSQLDLVAGQGIKFTQLETKDVSTLTVSTTGDNGSIGYWGSFWDMTDQTIASTTTAYVVNLGNANADNNGVSVVSGNRVTVANAGVYNIAVSVQVTSTNVQIYDAWFWFRKNGVDIPSSCSQISVPQSHGGTAGALIFYVNIFEKMAAGDYVQLVWNANDLAVSLQHVNALTSPTRPETPSVILTVNQV
jgi:hypothetical protein